MTQAVVLLLSAPHHTPLLLKFHLKAYHVTNQITARTILISASAIFIFV